MIAVFVREYPTSLVHRMIGSELRLGNSTIATENPVCGDFFNNGGFYACDLWGRYATLRRATTVETGYHAVEIDIRPQKNICPLGEVS